jgi:hypothetical protein
MAVTSLGRGLEINITNDAERAHRMLGRIPAEVIEPSFRRALTRAMTKAGVESSKSIRGVYAIKASRVKEAMTKTITGPYSGTVTFKATRPTLGGFKPTQNARGVAVTVKKGGRKTIRSAFMPKGGKLTGNRYGALPAARGSYVGGTFVPGKDRYPIVPLKTISVPVMLKQEQVIEPVMDATQKALRDTLEREVNYRLAKLA